MTDDRNTPRPDGSTPAGSPQWGDETPAWPAAEPGYRRGDGLSADSPEKPTPSEGTAASRDDAARQTGDGARDAGDDGDGYAPGAVPDEDEQETKPRPTGWARVREYLTVIVVAVVLSFLVKTFLVQPFWIPSGSMEDTLITGDRIVVNKLPGSTNDLKRGDVVVFEDPNQWLGQMPESSGAGGAVKKGLQFVGLYPAGDNHLVKRIIGVGGDHVVCCDKQGRITVNGKALNETYLRPGERPSLQRFDIRVPEGKLWLMGDNRSNSGDSREHDDGTGKTGSVPESAVTGKVLVKVWPLNRIGGIGDGEKVFSGVPSS